MQREILFAEPIVEQARRIVEAQLAEAPPPYVSPIPPGTTLRALFIGERGDAFVDLSADVTIKHTGGALDELFTIYAIVNALTVNLPAITRVQILIDGKEADTLAGHVDLRHPLQKNLTWTGIDDGHRQNDHHPIRQSRPRTAAADAHDRLVHHACGRLGADRGRAHAGHLHGQRRGPGAAVPPQQRQRAG